MKRRTPLLRLHNITNPLAGWWHVSEELMTPLEAGEPHLFDLFESPLGPLTGLIQADYPVTTVGEDKVVGYGPVGGNVHFHSREVTSGRLEVWTTAYLNNGDKLERITALDRRAEAVRPLLMNWIAATALQVLRMNGRDVPETLALQDSKQCPTCPSWGRYQCTCREYVFNIGGTRLEYGGGIGSVMGEHPSW